MKSSTPRRGAQVYTLNGIYARPLFYSHNTFFSIQQLEENVLPFSCKYMEKCMTFALIFFAEVSAFFPGYNLERLPES